MCVSVCSHVVPGPSFGCPLPVQSPSPATSVQDKLVQRGCLCTVPPPPDLFKLVHYAAHNVGKRAVGIRLKCILVTKINIASVLKDFNIEIVWERA